MYVHAQYQGKNVASALLAHLESVARSLGIQELYTEASVTARMFSSGVVFNCLHSKSSPRVGSTS